MAYVRYTNNAWHSVPISKRFNCQFVGWNDCYGTGTTKGDNMKIIKKDNGIEVQYTTKKGKYKNLVFTSRTKFVEFLDKKLGGLLDD